jgi:hypothetical protein
MKKHVMHIGLWCILGTAHISYASNNAEILHCPLEAKALPGWTLIEHGCDIDDNSVKRTSVFIVVKNLCNFSEKTDVFCCYGNKSLVRASRKNQLFTLKNPEKWSHKIFRQTLSQLTIQKYTCGPDANKTSFDQCLFSIQSKTTDKPKYPTLSFKDTMALGNKVYKQLCSTCHKNDATGMLPVILPLQQSNTMTKPITHTANKVTCGVTGTIMQTFGFAIDDQEAAITSQELAAVITYVRNSWGNNNQKILGKHAGGIIAPETVDIIRQQCSVCPACKK